MSDRTESFDVGDDPRISFRLPTGDARIVSGDPGKVVVRLTGRGADRFIVERRADTIFIEPEKGRWGRSPTTGLLIEVGSPPHVAARLATGDLDVKTPLADLTVDTAAGDVDAGDITGDLIAKSASGDIRAGAVGGRVEIAAASGDIVVGSVVGDASIKSAAGDLRIGAIGGMADLKSASGDVAVDTFTGDVFNAKTLSGDVVVGVTAGRTFDVSFQALSGDVRTDFPVGESTGAAPASLSITTMSGDITVRGAT
jgi:DUF4097 and DUF4098 domain-containing protein YvlB